MTAAKRVENHDANVVCISFSIDLKKLNQLTSHVQTNEYAQRYSGARRPTLLMYRVVCTDEDAGQSPGDDIGNLRIALNALVPIFML